MRLTWKAVLLLLLVLLLLMLGWLVWNHYHKPDVTPDGADCMARAEKLAAQWKAEGKSQALIEKLFQAELAKCSGVTGACSAMIGAVNADFAWLGRAVLSGTMAPAEYLARVRDRSRKLRESRKNPAICDAYARGDSDGDLVPDDRDKCPGTPNLDPTDGNGCPDTSPLPAAPTPEAIQKAASGLKIAMSRACIGAPIPSLSTVLKAGVAPDQQSFLVVISKVDNQPSGCAVFYELDILIHNRSFFLQMDAQPRVHKVFRSTDAITGAPAPPEGMTFRLLKSDPTIPWAALTFRRVEPGEVSERHFRVRTVNGNGLTAGWSALNLIPSTPF